MSNRNGMLDKLVLSACIAFLATGVWLAVLNISFFGDFGLGLFLGAFAFGSALMWDLVANNNYRYSVTTARWNIGVSFFLLFPYLIGFVMGAGATVIPSWIIGGFWFNCFASPAFSCLIIVLHKSTR